MFEGACPIIASYDEKDPLLPGKTTQRLTPALAAAGVKHNVCCYPGAGHQFLNSGLRCRHRRVRWL